MPTPTSPQSPGDSLKELSERVVRLEEHVGFAEHGNDQLSSEIAELGQRVAELARRLQRLETRVEQLATDDTPDTEPPL